MRVFIISLLFSLVSGLSVAHAQLTFEGGESNTLVVSYMGSSVNMFAVKDVDNSKSDGVVVLTLNEPELWSVAWEKKDGESYMPVIGNPLEGGVYSMPNQGDGIYRVKADRDGESFEKYFAIVNQYIKISDEDFTLEVENPDACADINIRINRLSISRPDFFESIVFTGVDNYELFRSGEQLTNIPSSTVLTSIQDCCPSPGEVTYMVRITDRYGFKWESNFINFKSRVPRAMFSLDPSGGEAPLEVSFTNESENADTYSWYVYKDFSSLDGVTELQDSLWIPVDNSTDISYIYKHPGRYAVKLIAVNDQGSNQCKSEYMLKEGEGIVVDSSLVQVPNVFTPNGDGKNDMFRVKALSLKSFHAVVFNRLGRKVFEWDDPKGGWNGKIGGSYAAPGTYFFVIEAVGAEQDNKKYVKKGTVLLIRER